MEALDKESGRLLDLSGHLIKSANSVSGGSAPVLENYITDRPFTG